MYVSITDLGEVLGYRKLYLLSGQVATTHCLEGHDDICNLQVSFLLQVGQDPRTEEDFALPNPVQVGVEFKGFDLRREEEEVPFSTGGLVSGDKSHPTQISNWKVAVGCLGRIPQLNAP